MSTQKLKSIFRERPLSGASGTRRALGYHPNPELRALESEQPGFSGTCENTSLADWIQLVQMGRRDAVVSVVSHDGGEGRLWYRGGEIIDASCAGITGEDAVYRVLSWEAGKVSVDFGAFERPRQIHVATAALLLQAAYRKDSGIRELAERPSPSASLRAPGVSATSTRVPSTGSVSKKRRRALGVALAGTAGILGLVLLSSALGNWFAPKPSPIATPGAVNPQFRVHVGVEPAHAEIWLDGKRVGVGQFEKTLPVDGVTHDIQCSAPGYVSERQVFRDAPPRRHVILEKGAESPPDDRLSARRSELVAALPSKPASPNRVAAPRPAVAQMKLSTAVALYSAAQERAREAATTKLDGPASEERHPRIQVIDEQRPRIEVIE